MIYSSLTHYRSLARKMEWTRHEKGLQIVVFTLAATAATRRDVGHAASTVTWKVNNRLKYLPAISWLKYPLFYPGL
jgi:hypothetical protein